MGVGQFLTKVLPTAGREIDLRHYADRGGRPLRVAVDISVIVHRATQGFGADLGDDRIFDPYGRAEMVQEMQQQQQSQEAQQQQQQATRPEYDARVQQYVSKCTKFVLNHLEQFRSAGMDVLVVLDGNTPPIKSPQVKERINRRKLAEAQRDAAITDTSVTLEDRAAAMRRTGAGRHFPLVMDGIISALRQSRIPFLVSPYESDGQLAFLSEKRYVDLVITEDSDLVACGASPVLYKSSMKRRGSDDNEDGVFGMLLRKEDLSCAKGLDLMDYSSAMLATVFVAAGSDYCDKLKGIGIITACDAARKAFHANPQKVNHRAPLEIFLEQLYKATYTKDLTDDFKREYEAQFLGALLMFRHPVVFNPITGQCETFRLHNPDPELMLYEPYAALVRDEEARTKFVGQPTPSPLACYVAEGWLYPRTLQPRRFTRLPDEVDAWYKEWQRNHPPPQEAEEQPAAAPADPKPADPPVQENPPAVEDAPVEDDTILAPLPTFKEEPSAYNDEDNTAKGVAEGATEENAICIDDDDSDDDSYIEVVETASQPDIPQPGVPTSLSRIQHSLRASLQKKKKRASNAPSHDGQGDFYTQQPMEE